MKNLKKTNLTIIALVILIIIVGVISFYIKKPKSQTNEQVSTFLMIHFEVGAAEHPWYKEISQNSDNKNLEYQKSLWPTAIKMVDEANKYNFKLTLAFSPQWGEYILKDPKKIQLVKKWQNQGHEIAFQHHGYDHLDWNGFSNKKNLEVLNNTNYRGNADEGFQYVKKLAEPEKVITGTITDAEIDLPNEIKIITYGGGQNGNGPIADTISKPTLRKFKNKNTIWLGHGTLESFFRDNKKSDNLLQEQKKIYNKASSQDVVGIVLHAHDFYRYSNPYLEWIKFINSKGNKIQTIQNIVEKS